MSPEEARQAVSDGAIVRLKYADGSTRGVGRVIAYSIVPTVTVEYPDGAREDWRHDMAVFEREALAADIASMPPDDFRRELAAARAELRAHGVSPTCRDQHEEEA